MSFEENFFIDEPIQEEVKEVREKQKNVKVERVRGNRKGFYLYRNGKEFRKVPAQEGGERKLTFTENKWKSFEQEN
jgi:hypothetical protein